MKSAFTSLIFVSVFSIKARSLHPCPDFKPIPEKEKIRLSKIIESDPQYKLLKSYPHTKLKFKLPNESCRVPNSYVSYFPQSISINGKNCGIKDMSFGFEFNKEKVSWSLPKRVTAASPSNIKGLLEQVTTHELSKNFFKKANYCHVVLQDHHLEWWIHLKDAKRNFCYLKASINGDKISVIKRLYAKDSKCEIYN